MYPNRIGGRVSRFSSSSSFSSIPCILSSVSKECVPLHGRRYIPVSPSMLGSSLFQGSYRTTGKRYVSQLTTQMSLDPGVEFPNLRHTKIVCTLGPASLDKIPELLNRGMNVARINCAHGDAALYGKMVEAVRKAEKEQRQKVHSLWKGILSFQHHSPLSVDPSHPPIDPATLNLKGSLHDVCAVAFDIKGPEIRTGKIKDDSPTAAKSGSRLIPLKKGDRFLLTVNPEAKEGGTLETGIYISYESLPKRAPIGQIIYIDDGNLELKILEIDAAKGIIHVETLTNHPLGERKNVNLPGLDVSDLPMVTLKDEVDIRTARNLGADFIFASFVQSAEAVRRIRELAGPDIRIISKIENQAGIDNYSEILSASDGIMVARGDLGVQIPAERVFLAQKMMIAKANVMGKPIICATQMLDSMITHPRPTRAEIVDVASAVLDGADAVMLSGETAKGAYPLESVQVMSQTCIAAEGAYPSRDFFNSLSSSPFIPVSVDKDEATLVHETAAAREWLSSTASGGHEGGVGLTDHGGPTDFMTAADVETLASSAVHAAWETKAAAIIVLTESGRTASLVAKYRPLCPVLCLCTDEVIAKRLQLRRGAHTLLIPQTYQQQQHHNRTHSSKLTHNTTAGTALPSSSSTNHPSLNEKHHHRSPAESDPNAHASNATMAYYNHYFSTLAKTEGKVHNHSSSFSTLIPITLSPSQLRALALRLVKEWNIAEVGQRVVVVHGQGSGDSSEGGFGGSTGVTVSLAQVK